MFQPTRPARGVTLVSNLAPFEHFVSTHTPRTGRDEVAKAMRTIVSVSTHTPRTGRDF